MEGTVWGEGRVQGALTDHVPERRQLPPGKRAGCEGASVEGHTKVLSACIMAGSAGLQTHPRSWVRPYATAAAALVVSLSSTLFTHMVSRPQVPMQLLPSSLLLSHSVRTLRESEDLQLGDFGVLEG